MEIEILDVDVDVEDYNFGGSDHTPEDVADWATQQVSNVTYAQVQALGLGRATFTFRGPQLEIDAVRLALETGELR